MGILENIREIGDAWARSRMGVQADIPLKNVATIVAERRATGEGGLTKKGEEIARTAAMRTGAGVVTYTGYTPAKVPVTGIYTSKDAQRTKIYTQTLVSQGYKPEESIVKQDAEKVAEKVAETATGIADAIGDAIDPFGTWWNKWKLPVTIGGIVIGGGLLLGYSGLGRPIGSALGREIEKEDK